jgi:hypothetical protein
MFDHIGMHVIHVPSQIFVAGDQMLPEPPLPYASLAFLPARFPHSFAFRNATRKTRLDQHPSRFAIAVILRQFPNGVQVIG